MGKSVKSNLIKVGAVALSMTTSASAIAVPQCSTLAEARAEHVRILQTELMVAALKCRARSDLKLYEKYNRFVRQYTPQLVAHGKSLTHYFERQHGTNYRQHMDKYITTLANTISLASDRNASFCDASSSQADTILASRTVTLTNVTVSNPDTAILTVCNTTVAIDNQLAQTVE